VADPGPAVQPGPAGWVEPPRNQVNRVQRSRMLAAMAEVALEHGARRATVAHVLARAGVSRRTFYQQFTDLEDGFLAVFDQAVSEAARTVVPAYRGGEGWPEQIRAGLAALLAFLDEEPALGRLCVVQARGAGPRVSERRAQALDALTDAVDRGRAQAGRGAEPLPLAAEGAVGAVLHVLQARLSRPTSAPLLGLLNPLTAMIVLPYLGPAAAARELTRPLPVARPRDGARNGGLLHPRPLGNLEIRMTYRTLRTLKAIARHPGASNRQVADAAGIADQGQISKLLRRLESRGLIRNDGAGQPMGEPNAWRLTPRGEEFERVIGELDK